MLRYSIIFATLINQILNQVPVEFLLEPTFLSDPELWEDWPTPPNVLYRTNKKNWWVDYDENAEHTGLLFAGKTEFSWIVDVRLEGEDQETWAVGNIVSGSYVVTNCRAIIFYHLTLESLFHIKVTFCSQYLEERVVPGEQKAGIRYVDQATLHPYCTADQGAYDVAVLRLTHLIEPSPPYIGYMPFPYNNVSMQIPFISLQYMNAQRRMCFVASFGKNFINKQNHLVVGFKVKYRVYIEIWRRCTRHIDLLCPAYQEECKEALKVTNDRRLMCMRTRAIVGTVCDHDRGAPVVCDGEVYGFVVRGAPYSYCNNRLPVEFVVSKIDALQNFLRPHLNIPVKPKKTRSKASTEKSCALLMAFLFALYLTNWPY